MGGCDDLVRGWEVNAESRELKATSVRKYRHFLKEAAAAIRRVVAQDSTAAFDVEALRTFRPSWKFSRLPATRFRIDPEVRPIGSVV